MLSDRDRLVRYLTYWESERNIDYKINKNNMNPYVTGYDQDQAPPSPAYYGQPTGPYQPYPNPNPNSFPVPISTPSHRLQCTASPTNNLPNQATTYKS